MDELLSPAEAGRLLERTAAAVRLMARRGELPLAARTEGGINLFRREDVLELVRKRDVARRARPPRRSR
jgi:hypothetical protein